MYRTLAQRRMASSVSSTPRRSSRAVYLIDYLTWHARLAGSTRPLSPKQPPADDLATPAPTSAETEVISKTVRAA